MKAMPMGARKTWELQTAGLVAKVSPFGRNAEEARERIATWEKCIAELETLPREEEWSCQQVNDYYGFGDCGAKTIAEIIRFLRWKIKDSREFWRL